MRPVEQREPPFERQRGTERRLPPGRHVREPRIGRERAARRHVDAVRIDGHGGNARARRFEHEPRALIAGVEPQTRGQIDHLLRAADDRNVIRRAGDAARQTHMLRDHFAQRTVALRFAVGEHRAVRQPRAARRDTRPQREREELQIGLTRTKCARRKRAAFDGERAARQQAAARGQRDAFVAARVHFLACMPRGIGHGCGFEAPVRQFARNETAAPDRAGQIAFRRELREHAQHGAARHAMTRGEVARRGQARARAEPPFENGRTQFAVEPAL